MAALPECIPQDVAVELRAAWADFPELLASLDKLIQRPLMPAICRALAGSLSTPGAWRDFFVCVLESANTAHLYHPSIRPARKDFENQRATAVRAGLELRAALLELADGYHGYLAPPELRFLWPLLNRAAIRNGYSESAADTLATPLLTDLENRLASLIQGNGGPQPLEIGDLLATLVRCLEDWQPPINADGQGQGTALGTVFVRALDSALARRGMDAKLLLTPEQTADLTRAAVGLSMSEPSRVTFGMSDEFDAKGNLFNAKSVISARNYTKKGD